MRFHFPPLPPCTIVHLLGDIPSGKKFAYYQSCDLAHPGLCAHLHRWCLPQIKACTKSITAQLAGWQTGGFFRLRSMSDGVPAHHSEANMCTCVLGRAFQCGKTWPCMGNAGEGCSARWGDIGAMLESWFHYSHYRASGPQLILVIGTGTLSVNASRSSVAASHLFILRYASFV